MKEFEMSDKQLEELLEACKPVRMMFLQCGTPSSPQENANRAWEKLGKEMGFISSTVEPISGKGQRWFRAQETKD